MRSQAAFRTRAKPMLLVYALLVSIPAVETQAQPAPPIRVDADADPDGNGESWATAYRYLQDALLVAGVNDEIWVAGGTYRPDDTEDMSMQGDRNATFELLNDLTVLGGFAGPGAGVDPDTRDIKLYETILSGDLLNNDNDGDIYDDTHDDNAYRVVTAISVTIGTRLDGFTIERGWGDLFNDDQLLARNSGAGLYCLDSAIAVVQCTFRRNVVGTGQGTSLRGYGGAVALELDTPGTDVSITLRQLHIPPEHGRLRRGDRLARR